jgi:multidrug efflux pump subunit AcrB
MPPPDQQPAAPSPALPAQYEFTEPQNRVIADLAEAMTWISAPLTFLGYLYVAALVLGILYAIQHPHAIPTMVSLFLAVVVYTALGRWLHKASESFERIHATTGHDIDHLMEALENLRKTFHLLSLLVKACLVVIVLGLVASLVLLSFYDF